MKMESAMPDLKITNDRGLFKQRAVTVMLQAFLFYLIIRMCCKANLAEADIYILIPTALISSPK